MSAQVTIQRTYTTTTTSAVLVNIGYFKTLPGILKILQILLGCVVVGIIGHYITRYNNKDHFVTELFLLLTATTCLICTTLLVVSCLFSIATASILPKTLFEVLYHSAATFLYVAGAIAFLVQLNERRSYYYWEPKIAAAIVLYNGLATYVLFSCAINYLRNIMARNDAYFIKERGYNEKIFAVSIALINGALYLLSTLYSAKGFRRG